MFPDSTLYKRTLPKSKLYENSDLTTAQKQTFSRQVRSILWRNKIAPSTANLAHGENVKEIQVFHLTLNVPDPDEKILRKIEQTIPYHLLFIMEFDGEFQLWLTPVSNSQTPFLRTSWREWDALPIRLEGMNMDEVYENFIHQLAVSEDPYWNTKCPIEENLALQTQRKKLEKEIAALRKKIVAEPQFNRQVEMNQKIKQLKNELESLREIKNQH